jgi:hypothetical protein
MFFTLHKFNKLYVTNKQKSYVYEHTKSRSNGDFSWKQDFYYQEIISVGYFSHHAKTRFACW